jgi:hypothetical protein
MFFAPMPACMAFPEGGGDRKLASQGAAAALD